MATEPFRLRLHFDNSAIRAKPARRRTDTVVALAPEDRNATTTGEVSLNVYQDLIITHAVSKEGGFVAAAAPANCSL